MAIRRPQRKTSPQEEHLRVVTRVILDKELYEAGTVVNWHRCTFASPPTGQVVVRWIDSFGRIVRKSNCQSSKSGVAPQDFEFHLDPGFTYRNWIRVWVDGVEQTAGAQFMFSPAPKPWDDFHVISWAHYPDGFLRSASQSGRGCNHRL